MIKKAMILSAGFGKRLNPLTLNCPKPLLKIGRETLLSNTINFLKISGIKKIIINVHYLSDQIIKYIEKNNFGLEIKIVEEKDKILDTGGGVLNAIENFRGEPFLIINPDTIWNKKYLSELKKMHNFFLENKNNKCLLLVTNKKNSFDKSFSGDFALENNFLRRKVKNKLSHIYTGIQIVKPEIFFDFKKNVFSMNEIWNNLILNNELRGYESNIKFLHVSTLNIYEELLKKSNIK